MDIVVVMKLVPDLVEELVVAADGRRIDRGATALKANEFDEQALEQGLLLKEAVGGELTAVAAETGDVDEMLYTALAKGATHAVKLSGDGFDAGLTNAQYADVLVPYLQETAPGVVLVGVQASDDLDGQLATWLAAKLGWPFATVVSGVEGDGDRVRVKKEFSGGLVAHLELPTPCILGIQAAPQPPRYAPISRVRQVMKTQPLEERQVTVPAAELPVEALLAPERTGHAEMIAGDAAGKAARLAEILAERGVL